MCDTPADPLGEIDDDCNYIENGWVDDYGDSYHPDVSNFMSYYGSCRSTFSRQQKGIMFRCINTWLSRDFINISDSYLAIDPDTYEPDNQDTQALARVINLHDRQCHSMHNSFIGNPGCADTEDWLRIENENGILEGYRIIIGDIDDWNNPVEDIVVYNTDNEGQRTNQLTTTFIDNGTSRIWEISCDALTPVTNTTDEHDYNDFLIQVLRGNNEPGFYEIELKPVLVKMPRITQAQQVCVGSVFDVSFLEPGATVTWTSDHLILSDSTGPSTTILSYTALPGQGFEYELNAIVEMNGCTYAMRRVFTEISPSTLPEIDPITMDVVGSACNPQFKFSIPVVEGALYYEWECAGFVGGDEEGFTGCYGDVVDQTQGLAYTHANAYTENGEDVVINVTVTVSNDCGIEKTRLQGFLYRPEGDCDIQGPIRSVDITPNPVNDSYFTLAIDDDTVNPDPYQIVIINQYGNISYMLQSPDKVHQISTLSFPNGLYYAEVVGATNLATTAFYILQ